mmetsp:Transcript_7693/g.8702  ORF Transcript_7693/g.8702 Transcript_7693/m.8702 type:complete len:91 (+) Transcript_7693:282-554(+)
MQIWTKMYYEGTLDIDEKLVKSTTKNTAKERLSLSPYKSSYKTTFSGMLSVKSDNSNVDLKKVKAKLETRDFKPAEVAELPGDITFGNGF